MHAHFAIVNIVRHGIRHIFVLLFSFFAFVPSLFRSLVSARASVSVCVYVCVSAVCMDSRERVTARTYVVRITLFASAARVCVCRPVSVCAEVQFWAQQNRRRAVQSYRFTSSLFFFFGVIFIVVFSFTFRFVENPRRLAATDALFSHEFGNSAARRWR